MIFSSYSQNFEDVMLWRALKHIERGFYVDIGAQHPIADSVSKAFYEHGWRGIHIEPVPEYADLLRKDRPDETVLQLAISDKEGILDLHAFPGTGLSTFNDSYANSHLKKHDYGVLNIKVPTLTLTQVLREQANRDIHWLKIDVEGYEEKVLKGWDSMHIRPWIIVIEATIPSSQTADYQTWEHFLNEADYNFVYFDGLNRFYVANEHRELAIHFQIPPNVFDGFVLSGTASSSFCNKITSERDNSVKLAANAQEQISSLNTKIQVLQCECDAAQLKTTELLVSSDHWKASAEYYSRELRNIYASTSWLLTSPLRKSMTILKRIVSFLSSYFKIMRQLPKRVVKHFLAKIILLTLNHPYLKSLAHSILARFPKLKQHIRLFTTRLGSTINIAPQITPRSLPNEDDLTVTSHFANNQSIFLSNAIQKWPLGPRKHG